MSCEWTTRWYFNMAVNISHVWRGSWRNKQVISGNYIVLHSIIKVYGDVLTILPERPASYNCRSIPQLSHVLRQASFGLKQGMRHAWHIADMDDTQAQTSCAGSQSWSWCWWWWWWWRWECRMKKCGVAGNDENNEEDEGYWWLLYKETPRKLHATTLSPSIGRRKLHKQTVS